MAVLRVHHYTVDAIRADHPGLSKTSLVKLEDGTYTDTWQWESAEQMGTAFAAAGTVAEIAPAMSLTTNATATTGEVVSEH